MSNEQSTENYVPKKGFFSGTLSSAIKNIKISYFRILLTLAPVYLIAVLTNYFTLLIEREIGSSILEYTFTLFRVVICEFILIICLYKLKVLVQSNNAAANIYWEISLNLFEILRIVVKKSLFVVIGFILLVIPGVYFSIKWFLVYPIYVFEHSEDPFLTSGRLTKGNFFEVFLIALAYWFVFFLSLVLIILLNIFIDNPNFSRTYYLIMFYMLGFLLTPIHVILEYEIYNYLKTDYRKTYNHTDLKLL